MFLRQGLPAVQVPEGDVAEAVKDAGRDVADAADGDVPLRSALVPLRVLPALLLGRSPGHPGVCHRDCPGHAPGRGVGPDAARRLAEHRLVAALAWPFRLRRRDPEGGLQVGHAVDGDGAVLVGQQHRVGERGGPGPQVHAGGVDERAVDAEPPGGVVVAADQDHPGAGRAQPGERFLVQRDRVHRRDRPVVDVAGHEHGVHPLGGCRLDEVVEERSLRLPQVGPVERPPEVPVRGMQEPHGKDGSERP